MNDAWLSMNQRHLSHAVAAIRDALERHVTPDATPANVAPQPAPPVEAALPPPALDTLSTAFELSRFERALLVLCAGVELDTRIAALCARAQRSSALVRPTFSLALAALPEPHWSALSPDAPLRRWRLIEVSPREEPLTLAPLRIPERVLHHLAGVSSEEAELCGLLSSIESPGDLPPSQEACAAEVARGLSRAIGGEFPVVQLCGAAEGDARQIAAAGCRLLGLGLRAMRAADVPAAAAERLQFARLWERESILGSSALLIEFDERETTDSARAVVSLIETVRGLVIVSAREALRFTGRISLRVDVARPHAAEQRLLWLTALGPEAAQLNGALDRVLGHFDFSARHVRAVGAALRSLAPADGSLGTAVWEACRRETRPRLDGLAQRIASTAAWDDLVLPDSQRKTLREIAAQLRCRHTVHQAWGFAARGARGLGVTALFAGASGTGKTFAAEVLAAELRLDLYRIDLSQVVSKYIGETEKNLRRVFDAAEGSGAILLFDEADALFGKRSEVRDSHDRYANIEVSYLLQQMEAYRGLAVLTTNLKQALDPAFLRRIRFVVTFPFPGPADRAEIWRRIFPADTPVEALDFTGLARLNVAGGNIRNIALNAAFRAADEGTPVRMAHLLHATRAEYEKLERPLTDAEAGVRI